MDFLCEKDVCSLESEMKSLSESLNIRFFEIGGNIEKGLEDLSQKNDYGLVVTPPIKPSFFRSMTRPVLIDLALRLTCPLLVARNSAPYERIVVPFNGGDSTESALHIGMDLSRQMNIPLVAIVVEEPDFLHGDQTEDSNWKDQMLERIRDLAHEHKAKVSEIVKNGNPVREIISVCESNDMMIVGCDNTNKDLFTLNVAEHLVKKAACSVMLVLH
jgi:nucleotide-binding universal stress UspA family protein